MNYLFVINDAPYGNERPYNALRHAMNLVKREGVQVKVFLVADAVYCPRKDQKTPEGYYNIERMVKSWARCGRRCSTIFHEIKNKRIRLPFIQRIG